MPKLALLPTLFNYEKPRLLANVGCVFSQHSKYHTNERHLMFEGTIACNQGNF